MESSQSVQSNSGLGLGFEKFQTFKKRTPKDLSKYDILGKKYSKHLIS
jgi:hypothetical protein